MWGLWSKKRWDAAGAAGGKGRRGRARALRVLRVLPPRWDGWRGLLPGPRRVPTPGGQWPETVLQYLRAWDPGRQRASEQWGNMHGRMLGIVSGMGWAGGAGA